MSKLTHGAPFTPMFMQGYNYIQHTLLPKHLPELANCAQFQKWSPRCFDWFLNASFLFGAFHLYDFTSRIVRGLWRNFIRPICQANDKNYQKYGLSTDSKANAKFARKSWAVVTGGSDGIGLAFCQKLADEGFNIMIVARDEQKMKEKCADLKKNSTNKKLQAKYIVANFREMDTIEQY